MWSDRHRLEEEAFVLFFLLGRSSNSMKMTGSFMKEKEVKKLLKEKDRKEITTRIKTLP